jgi:hypothetical protein
MSAVEDLRDEMFAVGKANLKNGQPALGATCLYYAAALRDALIEDAEEVSA